MPTFKDGAKGLLGDTWFAENGFGLLFGGPDIFLRLGSALHENLDVRGGV